MLRLAVLLLLLANAAYYAWSQGLLAPAGLEPLRQTEPQRLRQQIKPETLRITPAGEARAFDSSAATSAAKAAPECLQAGVFEDAQAASLRQTLEPWPAGSWSLEPTVEPARWIVYMGKYVTLENLSRKKAELRQIGVSFEAPANPALEPGLSLGSFVTEAAANAQLEALAQRGIRTARVVQDRPEVRGLLLKLPAVDESLRARLEGLRPTLNGRALQSCR
jgi:hypothetical protein